MKKTISTIMIAAFCFTALQAQNATENKVKEIRAEYTSLKKQIADMEKTKSSKVIYCMQLEDNVFDSRAAGERFYNDKTKFYYNSDRELRMVIQKTVSGAQTTYKEIMYINEKTAFVYVKEEGENNEKRLYYSGEKFIRFMQNDVEKSMNEASEETVWMLRDADYFKQIFQAIMNKD